MKKFKMHFYVAVTCCFLVLLVSCNKDNKNGLTFPRQFNYDSFYSGDMKVFVLTNTGFSEIAPSGSFTNLKNDALTYLGDYKDVLAFDEINLQDENTATLKNNIPGHDYFGFNLNASYSINAPWVTFTVQSPIDNSTAEFTSQLTDNNEALLQYARFFRYSYVKPNGNIGYWGIDIEGGNFFNDINSEIENIEELHNFSIGDTLAIGYIVGKLL